DIGQAGAVTKLNAVRVPSVLSANAQFDSGTSLVALLHGNFDQLTDPILVDRCEWVFFDDLELLVRPQEGARIVSAHPEARLGQVISAKTEEFGRLRNLIRRERTTGHLNHRTHEVIQLHALFLHDLGSNLMNDLDLQV